MALVTVLSKGPLFLVISLRVRYFRSGNFRLANLRLDNLRFDNLRFDNLRFGEFYQKS